MRGILIILGLIAVPAAGPTAAQDVDERTEPDSLLSGSLKEVVVRAGQRERDEVSTVQRLPVSVIEGVEAPSAAGLLRQVAAAHVTTNSRGETLVYLRGSDERQTAIFYDGAALNVPWDNRLDLALIPGGMVGGMTVTRGVAAVEYGANVPGGVIHITSPSLASEGQFTEASALGGTAGTIQAEITHRGRIGGLGYAASVGFFEREGMPLPDDARLPFNQLERALRTNTDRRVANGFMRGVYRFGDRATLGATIYHVEAQQGVAPEGHVPTDRARLWRYPLWRYTMGIFSGEGRLAGPTRWKATSWTGRFEQTIDAYGSLDFDHARSRQEDSDLTHGIRLTVAREIGPGTLRVAGNGLISTHHQREMDFDENKDALPDVAPRFAYRQRLLSLGAAYELPVTRRFTLTMSAGRDVMFMPKTGDKPERDPFRAYSATLGGRYDGIEGFYLRAAAGRKTRFPTMRELFGEAMHRFLVNPDLAPESALIAEAGGGLAQSSFSMEIVPFLNRTSESIGQLHVTVDGQRRRQRINLKGSRILGVELVAEVRPVRYLAVNGHVTFMDVRSLRDEADDPVRLAERPEVLGTAMLRYIGQTGLSALLETVYTGAAYSQSEDNSFVPLDPSLSLNARIGYRFDHVVGVATAELFIRGDNLTDAPVVSQLGLPGPGRMLRAGAAVSF